jgi:hypothetical protein
VLTRLFSFREEEWLRAPFSLREFNETRREMRESEVFDGSWSA